MPAIPKPVLAGLSTCALVTAALAVLPGAASAVDVSSGVVLSEVYGGGGNTGAQYTNDFIELYNHGSTAQSVAGWSVQYSSATGTSWQSTPLTGTIPAGGYYLVKEGAGSGAGAALPTPNDTGTIALSATNGKVALVNSATALTGCATACSSAPGVVDFLGFGTANDAAGSATPPLTNSTSDQRTITPFTNTGNNASDFTAGAPTPAAAGSTPPPVTDCSSVPTPPECVPGTTTIQDVQGDGFVSPLKGSTVDKVAGIVTAIRTSGSRGFWMQEAPRTSPGPAPRPACSSSPPRQRSPWAIRCWSAAASATTTRCPRARRCRPPRACRSPSCHRPPSPRSARATRCRHRWC